MGLNAMELAIYRNKENIVKLIFQNGGKFSLKTWVESIFYFILNQRY